MNEEEYYINYVFELRKKLMNNMKKYGVAATSIEDMLYVDFYTLLVLTTGENTTLEDVHNAWACRVNRKNKTHPSLVPFNELSKEVQDKDIPYQQAIIETAKQIKLGE